MRYTPSDSSKVLPSDYKDPSKISLDSAPSHSSKEDNKGSRHSTLRSASSSKDLPSTSEDSSKVLPYDYEGPSKKCKISLDSTPSHSYKEDKKGSRHSTSRSASFGSSIDWSHDFTIPSSERKSTISTFCKSVELGSLRLFEKKTSSCDITFADKINDRYYLSDISNHLGLNRQYRNITADKNGNKSERLAKAILEKIIGKVRFDHELEMVK